MSPKIFITTFVTTVVVVSFANTPFCALNKQAHTSNTLLIQTGLDPDPDIQAKRDFIKMMMKDAWSDYVRSAWGANELKPLSRTWRYGNIYGYRNIGATIIDALDT
ncbi:unnamed protein product, partial [Allacma fusca]